MRWCSSEMRRFATTRLRVPRGLERRRRRRRRRRGRRDGERSSHCGADSIKKKIQWSRWREVKMSSVREQHCRRSSRSACCCLSHVCACQQLHSPILAKLSRTNLCLASRAHPSVMEAAGHTRNTIKRGALPRPEQWLSAGALDRWIVVQDAYASSRTAHTHSLCGYVVAETSSLELLASGAGACVGSVTSPPSLPDNPRLCLATMCFPLLLSVPHSDNNRPRIRHSRNSAYPAAMIREGKQQGWLSLPVDTLPVWATFNAVSFNGVGIGPLPGKEDRGSTVIAKRSLKGGDESPLMTIPRELILSLERVHEHAKSDSDFRSVLDGLDEFGRVGYLVSSFFLLYLCSKQSCLPICSPYNHFLTGTVRWKGQKVFNPVSASTSTRASPPSLYIFISKSSIFVTIPTLADPVSDRKRRHFDLPAYAIFYCLSFGHQQERRV